MVGKDETVECPECGKECEGRGGYKIHVTQHCEGEHEESSRSLFYTQRQIFEQIAESSSFDWRTVSNLLSVASIPEQFQAFVKIPEERSSQEKDRVSDLVGSGFWVKTIR